MFATGRNVKQINPLQTDEISKKKKEKEKNSFIE